MRDRHSDGMGRAMLVIETPSGPVKARTLQAAMRRSHVPLRVRWVSHTHAPVLMRPTTALAPFVGVRVEVQRTQKGVRYTWVGVFDSLWHSPDHGWVGGMMRYEPNAYEPRGGNSAMALEYLNATIQRLPNR